MQNYFIMKKLNFLVAALLLFTFIASGNNDDKKPDRKKSVTTNESHWGGLSSQPNIMILITDQQRTTQHFPEGWVKRNLPNLDKLQSSGVTFPNAMTATTACSPSRATLFTSTYPTLNGVIDVGNDLLMGQDIQLPGNEKALPLATIADMLQNKELLPPGINYELAYKGKWHLDADFVKGLSVEQQKAVEGTLQQNNIDMESIYGFSGWTSQEFGTAMATGYLTKDDPFLYTLGAGVGGNDERVVKGVSYPQPEVKNAVDFLNDYKPNQDKTNPFFLVVSLLNPHDIWAYPDNLEVAGFKKNADGVYPWNEARFQELTTPESFNLSQEQLFNKPTIQATWRSVWQVSFDEDDANEYVRFYAYLHTLSDALLGDVVAAMENNPGNLKNNTLIVRLADHGEMAMAQGGMIEKACQVYNETLLIPMTFSAPFLPQGKECTGLAGLIDIVPTIASIIGMDLEELKATYPIQGNSIDKALLDPESDTRSQLLFVTDDDGAHIRCLIEIKEFNAKYAVYYDADGVLGAGNPNGTASNFQYEMYNYQYKPNSLPASWDSEMTNLLPKTGIIGDGFKLDPEIQTKWHKMHIALTKHLEAKGQKPTNWPAPPPTPNK